MLGVTVFQKETHCAQVSALGFLEQGILHAGQRGLCTYADCLLDTRVLSAPAPESAHRYADLLADLRLRQAVHCQPLQTQQSAGAVPFPIWDSRAKVSPPYEKTAHTGSTLEEPYGRRMTRVCTVLAMKNAGAGKE